MNIKYERRKKKNHGKDDTTVYDECNIKRHTKYKSTKAQNRMNFRIGNKKKTTRKTMLSISHV